MSLREIPPRTPHIPPIEPFPCGHEAEIARLQAEVASVRGDLSDAVQEILDHEATIDRLQTEVSEWRIGANADKVGHLHRCAEVNGVWNCADGCPQIIIADLRREVERVTDERNKFCDRLNEIDGGVYDTLRIAEEQWRLRAIAAEEKVKGVKDETKD